MIWLPGFLSQGGEKFMWARYGVSYEMVRTRVGERDYAFSSGMSIDILTGYNLSPSTGKFSLQNKQTILAGNEFTVAYNNKNNGFSYYSGGLSGFSVIYEYQYVSKASYGGDTDTYTTNLYELKAQTIRGDLIDVVSDRDPSAYPENGVQGSYWYVKFSDTPITWERYSTSEGEVRGADDELTTASTTYYYRATSYSRSGKTFTASGTRTRASSLSANNNYLIKNNGEFVNSTNMSGDTLYKITSKSGSSTVTLKFATYTVGDAKGSYIDTVTSYNPYEYPDDGAQDGYWYVKV